MKTKNGRKIAALMLAVTMVLTSCGTAPEKTALNMNNIQPVNVVESGINDNLAEIAVETDIAAGVKTDLKEKDVIPADETEAAEAGIETSVEKEAVETSAARAEKVHKDNSKNDAKVKLNTDFIKGNSKAEEADNQETDGQDTEKADIVESLIEQHYSNSDNDSQENLNSYNPDVAEDGSLNKPFDLVYPEVFESEAVEYADNTILIKTKKSFDGVVNSALDKAGIGKLELIFDMENYSWYTAYLYKEKDVNTVMENVRGLKEVVVAEYNYKSEAASVDSSSLISEVRDNPKVESQDILKMCDIQKAWGLKKDDSILSGGSRNVTVAVIDTGVDYNHKDLKSNIWTNSAEIPDNGIDDDGDGYVDDYYGVDMTAKYGSGMDDHGHGTHVAGIISATNNKEGIVGIAYNTKIMPIKAGDASGYFAQDNIAKAIIYAYDHGADVINMSFGGSAASIAVQDALETAYTRCVLVAAAGNDGAPNEGENSIPSYPAALSYVIGVMSCGYDGNESSFSNWDVYLFNNVEYEVYAPGEQIISTLPGDKYGKLSGTSMASPVVAAQAALLRSYYTDTDKYPTKFIYGQIVSTADIIVSCCNPERHNKHNIPCVVNFYNSLTNLPTPDVGATDYRIFDTAGFQCDEEGITAGCEDINNGDGIIDSGEIIAFGFTLRNRWGMSKDTIVHIDTDSSLGIASQYVEILNNDINYGSVGTYSDQDCDKIYDEQGDYWIAWKNPFYIRIKDNCPNGYTIPINVTVTCKNGLDNGDAAEYTSKSSYIIEVRRGEILPNKITEDTTLTKDKYYIIPNSMVVMEGATLTIEAGTHIQFWCSDPGDAYADTAITYLKVMGKLITKGTEEEPVVMAPSKWMDRYRVEIYTSGSGCAELEYTNITNPYISVNKASYCEFTQNNNDDDGNLYYRKLKEGVVYDLVDSALCSISVAKGCVFYKLGGARKAAIFGNIYNGCIFVDCVNSNESCFENCVFYGNYRESKTSNNTESMTSTIYIGDRSNISVEKIFRNSETGITYMVLNSMLNDSMSYSSSDDYLENYEKKINPIKKYIKNIGGAFVTFDSKQEYDYVISNISYTHANGNYFINFDIKKDNNAECWIDTNGNEVPSYLEVDECNKGNTIALYSVEKNKITNEGYTYRHLFEIPGDVYITDIKLSDYLVDIDMDSTYQINALLEPYTADESSLLYESVDETIAKVDEKGVVTPVAVGTTNIRVYSPDMAVSNYVTVNVKDAVDLNEEAAPGEAVSGEAISVEEEPAKNEVIHTPQIDEEKMADRKTITSEEVLDMWDKFVKSGGASTFHSNVILNRLSDDNVEHWMRITAPESEEYSVIYLGKNYWGTTNEKLIEKQIVDFDDYQDLADIEVGEILTEAPSNTYPFVVDAYLKVNDKKTTTVGNDLVTFVVVFNRDMDQDIKLNVCFGSSYPYADYEIGGEYVSPRQWEGTVKLNTLIENGYQYWSISNGKAAGTSLKLYRDWGRFPFKIDTFSAQSLLMQGSAELDGIHVTWEQDDFETLAGYNIYRSDKEDGFYEKLNKSVIEAETKEFVDTNVEPGQKYYYNFTVVQSDMKESEPSGKLEITALDTMAPNIYHSPVFSAFTGNNLVISATITDNVAVTEARLFYRMKGAIEWKTKVMTKQNDRYSAMIASEYVTTDGLEYYIEATDGNEVTRKGEATDPFEIVIQQAIDDNSLGDVDGNGVIELKDAIMLLMAINDRLNLTAEEFARADIDKNGSLAAKEALRIMQYVNGTVTTIAL